MYKRGCFLGINRVNLFEKLVDQLKQHPHIAVLFLIVGVFIGVMATRYIPGLAGADTVLHDSYLYKTEVQSKYVPIEQFTAKEQALNNLKTQFDVLQAAFNKLQLAQGVIAKQACERFANEVTTLSNRQQTIDQNIQSTLSGPSIGMAVFGNRQAEIDDLYIQELRKSSEQLNQQILQIRSALIKCVNPLPG